MCHICSRDDGSRLADDDTTPSRGFRQRGCSCAERPTIDPTQEQIKYATMVETTRPVNSQKAAGGGLSTGMIVVVVVVCVALVAIPIVIAGKNLTR